MGLVVAALLAAGCGVGYPWPESATPTDTTHRDVLLLGDSLMGNTYSQLPALVGDLDVTIADRHVNGSGLTSPILGLDPLDFVREQLDLFPATDLVVIEWAGACATPCEYEYGSQAWVDAWEAKAREIVEEIQGRGIAVAWSVSPPPPPGENPGPPYTFSDVGSNLVGFGVPVRLRDSYGIPLVQMRRALSHDDGFLGAYDTRLWWDFFDGGAWHDVRLADLIHLSADGAFRSASWVRAMLRDEWDTLPVIDAPALRRGPVPEIVQPEIGATP